MGCSLVICAANPRDGAAALKAWTYTLGLPRGKLHGMPAAGTSAANAPLSIRYSSGDGGAHASGYGGDYRGVLLSPALQDSGFRQYGYLPLTLFEPPPAAAEPPKPG